MYIRFYYTEHMSRRRYLEGDKQKILALIREGVSYSKIQRDFGVPKSTLSYWVSSQGTVRDTSKQKAHLELARAASAASLRAKKVARLNLAVKSAQEIGAALSIEQTEIGKSLLAMLYWAEGGKQDGNMKFTNTDPDLVYLFLELLRKHYQIDESRLHVALLVHPYHNQGEVIDFWSDKLKINKSQFWKVYIKPRSGLRKEYRRNFYGICNVHYASCAIQRELIALGKYLAANI
jgi:transposase-like protein